MTQRVHCLFISAVLCVVAINAEPQSSAPNMPSQQVRSNEDRLSTDSLISRINLLQDSADWWNRGYLWVGALAVVVTALSGGTVAYFQYTAVNKARLLADAEAELGRVKERDKNLQIAVLERDTADARRGAATAEENAGKATERAAKAEERAVTAESHLANAQRETAVARREAAEANTKADGFRLDIARANERAAQADLARRQLELQLAEMFADRTITPSQIDRIASLLRPFAGQTVDITIFGETNETTQFSNLIFECFAKGGWSANITRPTGGGSSAKGLLVALKPDSSTVLHGSIASVINILRESLKNGVGPWDFDKLAPPQFGVSTVSQMVPKEAPPEQRPAPTGTSPLRIVIGSK